MDPREIDAIVQRLVANPHDQDALAYAHQWGAVDPRSYAHLLEKVGFATQDDSDASHWLSEAANIWAITVGDLHRAARVLMVAIERDPTQELAAERLAHLYREKGEHKSLVALLERRAKALDSMLPLRAELMPTLHALHLELGRLWANPPLSQPRKGLEHFLRVLEIEPRTAYAIYAIRELYKQQNQYADALPLFESERQLVDDPQRKVALYRDEATLRREMGDVYGAGQALRHARAYLPEDPTLAQEFANLVLHRIKAGEPVDPGEREEVAALLVTLAETFGGEHGLAYSLGALRAQPGHDRAMQLAAHFSRSLGKDVDLSDRWAAYLAANPTGPLANEARTELLAVASEAAGLIASVPSSSVSVPAPVGSPPSDFGALRDEPDASPALRMPTPDAFSRATPKPRRSPPVPLASSGPSSRGPSRVESTLEMTAHSDAPAEGIDQLLCEAGDAAAKGNKATAFAKYEAILMRDPVHEEALAWVKDHLRQKRKYSDLRATLVRASRAVQNVEQRKQILRDIASLCEQQLRDVDGAIQAFKQLVALDRNDSGVSESLRRLLERSSRWDELASLLEEEAMMATEIEVKRALEKKLAHLHESKRKDSLGAAEAWLRISTLSPADDQALLTTVKLFEKANRQDLAAQAIAQGVGGIEDKAARVTLLVRLGDLRDKLSEPESAGEAYEEAAEITQNPKMWEAAERAYTVAGRLAEAARALDERATLGGDPKTQASLFAKASVLYAKAGDEGLAIARLEKATTLEPANDDFAQALEQRYVEAAQWAELADHWLARANQLPQREKRAALRKRAAELQRDQLDDADAARATFLNVLEDGEDAASLRWLADYAHQQEQFDDVISLLRRLDQTVTTSPEHVEIRLQEAQVLAEHVGDPDSALRTYRTVLDEFDASNQIALARIADLEAARDNPKGAVEALERLVPLVADTERADLAQRMALLYEGTLANPAAAAAALEIVRSLHEDDLEVVERLSVLYEQLKNWPKTIELLQILLEVAVDEHEVSSLSRKLSQLLEEHADGGEEALALLERPADAGDRPCRDAYVALGDKLGNAAQVAAKLVSWYELTSPSPERNQILRGAFDRFVRAGHRSDAIAVALDLAQTKGSDATLTQQLEELALQEHDENALQTAHSLRLQDASSSPAERAVELVRQAEVLLRMGHDPSDAIQHGELGLAGTDPNQTYELLHRLAAMAPTADAAVDVFERHVSRSKTPVQRLVALGRAAQASIARGLPDRARTFFDLALTGQPSLPSDLLDELEAIAKDSDGEGNTAVQKCLAEAFAQGGHGFRDGGRTRSLLLRRAANLAYRQLDDSAQAFQWLADGIVCHVDAASLDALEELGRATGDSAKVEEMQTRALGEVFDGPLVRQLLTRRAALREHERNDLAGAAHDLRKLHELSPSDQDVFRSLRTLLERLEDHRTLVQVLEDQILRGKDPLLRVDLARTVAKLWEERLADSLEAADAWRRVLRMRPGDEEAQAGLERAKQKSLRGSDAPDEPDSVSNEHLVNAVIEADESSLVSFRRPSSERFAPPPSSQQNQPHSNEAHEAVTFTGETDSDENNEQTADLSGEYPTRPPPHNAVELASAEASLESDDVLDHNDLIDVLEVPTSSRSGFNLPPPPPPSSRHVPSLPPPPSSRRGSAASHPPPRSARYDRMPAAPSSSRFLPASGRTPPPPFPSYDEDDEPTVSKKSTSANDTLESASPPPLSDPGGSPVLAPKSNSFDHDKTSVFDVNMDNLYNENEVSSAPDGAAITEGVFRAPNNLLLTEPNRAKSELNFPLNPYVVHEEPTRVDNDAYIELLPLTLPEYEKDAEADSAEAGDMPTATLKDEGEKKKPRPKKPSRKRGPATS